MTNYKYISVVLTKKITGISRRYFTVDYSYGIYYNL